MFSREMNPSLGHAGRFLPKLEALGGAAAVPVRFPSTLKLTYLS